ncbi:MAG: hypothetical protein IJE05_07440 [Clostridia bacterium]|nr:hypothetical protein [Clostridia bacterium]
MREVYIKGISDRDDITHNKTIKLDNISIGIYEIVSKLNYIMILNYIGIAVIQTQVLQNNIMN